MGNQQERIQTLEAAIDALTKERKKDARRHSDEVHQLARAKATVVLQSEEQELELHGLRAAIDLLNGENDSLQTELNSVRAQRSRAENEAGRLLRKIATLQDQVNGVDEKEEAITNHFDPREHHREM